MQNRLSSILGSDGEPLKVALANGNGHSPNGNGRAMGLTNAKSLSGYYNSYVSSLGLLGQAATARAGDPFMNNPWVFASAMVVAIASSQAPARIYRETGKATEMRRLEAKSFGRTFDGPKAGKGRRAFHRHLDQPVASRFGWSKKGIKEDLSHPLHDVLLRKPNDYQNGSQLRQVTDLLCALELACMWVQTDADDNPIGPGEQPAKLWPYSPKYFEPILEHAAYGKQVGWWFTAPRWAPGTQGLGMRMPLEMHQVIHFKFPNPNNPLASVARLTPVAAHLEMDELAIKTQRALLKRGATPKGIMTCDAPVTPEDVRDKQEEFEQNYGGTDNSGEVPFLYGGWKYQVVGLTPEQMQHKEQMGWDREAELAVMGTSAAALGITSKDTYAAELLQIKGLFDRNIIPMKNMQEETLDATLFYPETDDVFLAHDYKKVESLRAGLEHQVNIADKLAGQNLHCPPRRAYEIVGLDVEQYEGDEQSLVSPMLAPAKDVASGALEQPAPPPVGDPNQPKPPVDPGQPKPGTPNDGQNPDDSGDAAQGKGRAPGVIVKVSREEFVLKGKRRWAEFDKLQRRIESPMKGAYRGWVAQIRRELFRNFDTVMGLKADSVDLTGIIPDPGWMASELMKKARPIHTLAQQATYDFTKEEIGVPVFDIQSERFHQYFNRREKLFAGETTGTLVGNVKATLIEGMQQNPPETIQQLRSRLSHVLDVAEGSAKTLQVARTESAGFMNGQRDEMFAAQGFSFGEWVTAGDETVRDNHVIYGGSGPKPRGFNYLNITGEAGTLTHPGDMGAPPGEVINCRCLAIAADDPS